MLGLVFRPKVRRHEAAVQRNPPPQSGAQSRCPVSHESFLAVDGVRVAVTGAGEEGVFRHSDLESALSSNFSEEAVSGVEVSSDGLMSDIHASADYRANLIGEMTKRAVSS